MMPTVSKATDKNSEVRVISRAFGILDLFAAGSDKLTLMAIVNATGLSKATVFRLLSTFLEDDILRQTPAGEYELGFFSVKRAHEFLSAHSMIQRFGPSMKSLSQELGETIILSQRNGDVIVDLEVFQAPTAVINVPPVGCPALLHSRLPGLNILRGLSHDERQAYLQRHVVGTNYDHLVMPETAETGHCVTQEIIDRSGQIFGAIWISVPWGRTFDRASMHRALSDAVRLI